jgi:hypothetical protein
MNLNKWNGYNILAVDGTTLQVPDTSENIEVLVQEKINIPLKLH